MTTTWDPEAFTRALIEDMRAHDGQVTSGPMAGKDLMILTTTGAKTGQQHTAIVTWTRDGDAYVVAGSKGGAPTNPAWIHNLRANPNVTVEAGGRAFEGRAEEATGADRDRLWNAHVERWPEFGEYPKKTDRLIPMIRIFPTDDARRAS
jgi:deazaflavin-dependent oxidoreductase (nitroreductase family)